MNDKLVILPDRPWWLPSAATVVAALAGFMMTTALPPFKGTAPLALLSLAVLFHLLRNSQRPGRLAFAFGLAHQTLLLSWLFFLEPSKSIPTRALVPLQAVGAILFVSAHYGVFGLVVGAVRRRLGARSTLVLLPVLWVLLELSRTVGELGFPWCLTGAAWLSTPLRSLYAAAGEIGTGAATALTASALVAVTDIWRDRPRSSGHRWALVAVSVLCWLGLWWGSLPVDSPPAAGQRTEPLKVACAQANVAQADKWDDAKIDSTIIPYTMLTEKAAREGAELVTWAETSIPAYVRYNRDLMDWVRALAKDNRLPLVAGFPDARLLPAEEGDEPGKRNYLRYNAAGLFSDHGTLVDTYGKHHLVPMGERFPFQWLIPALAKVDVGQAEWTVGDPPAPMALETSKGEVPLFVLICYEAVFSNLTRQAVRQGGSVIVNVTNDVWFGHVAGPLQHAALSRIRAIECGVPLVRCANNGISMICGPDGEIISSLGLHKRGLVTATIPTVARGTRYVQWGVWPVMMLLALWIPVGLFLVRRDRRFDPEEES